MTQSDLSKSFVNLNQSDLDYVKINKRRKVLILGGPGVGNSNGLYYRYNNKSNIIMKYKK